MPAAGDRERQAARLRRSRRQFVRAHHPDIGGDPEAFAEGLRRFEPPPGDGLTGAAARVTGVRRPRGARRLVWALEKAWRRRHAPPRVR